LISGANKKRKENSGGLMESIILWKDRMSFPIDLQLEFIELLESFGMLRKQDAFLRLKEVYELEYGSKSVLVSVCVDLMKYQAKGRLELGFIKWFDKDLLFMYRVSEYIEDRSEAIEIIAKNLFEEKKLLKDNFILAMLYPTFILFLLLGIILGFYGFMFPMLGKAFDIENVYDHLPSGALYIGLFVEHFGVYLLLLIGALRFAYVQIRNNWVGKTRDKWSQKFPLIIYRHFQSAKLLHSISMMRKSDMSFLDILNKLEGWVDPYLKSHVKRLISGTVQGKDKKSYFGVGLFSGKQLTRLRAQQEQGGDKFSEALTNVAVHANKDAALAIRKYAKRIELVIYSLCLGLGMLVLKSMSALMMMTDI
jgi:type II secretory pathway component PulF